MTMDNSQKIFRYKFADSITEEINRFAQIHREDDRHQFKDAWNIWKEENQDIIQAEVHRLSTLDYEGDPVDKMFKSARYYFRKKGTEKKEPATRRMYVPVDKSILQVVDRHIEAHKNEEGFTPAIGYNQFCAQNEEILEDWIENLQVQAKFDVKEIQDKIKKTYKNRYYVMTNR